MCIYIYIHTYTYTYSLKYINNLNIIIDNINDQCNYINNIDNHNIA